MVFGFKGPKAVLSSAISNALDEYFVVDASAIESNLLKDAKIVLRNVQLRDQVSEIPKNGEGNRTIVKVTGTVEEVTFRWSWSGYGGGGGAKKKGGDNNAWVQDAALIIKGPRFKAELSHGPPAVGDDDGAVVSSESSASSGTPSFVSEEQLKANAAEIKKEGGLNGYVRKQVEMIVDSLTLSVIDLELTAEVVASSKTASKKEEGEEAAEGEAKEAEEEEKEGGGERTAIVFGGKKFELTSEGRHGKTDGRVSKLHQKLSIESMFAKVLTRKGSVPSSSGEEKEEGARGASGDDDVLGEIATIVSHPFLEEFTYGADWTRTGKRFAGFGTGLEVRGVPPPPPSPPADERKLEAAAASAEGEAGPEGGGDGGGHLVVHAGSEQLEALSRLSVMVLAPAEPAAGGDKSEVEPSSGAESAQGGDGGGGGGADAEVAQGGGGEDETGGGGKEEKEEEEDGSEKVSTFVLPVPSVSLVLRETTRITVRDLLATYRADGTVATIEADGFDVQGTSPSSSSPRSSEEGGADEEPGGGGGNDALLEASAKKLRGSMRPEPTFTIDEITTLIVPGTIRLDGPLSDLRVKWDDKSSIATLTVPSMASMVALEKYRIDLARGFEGKHKADGTTTTTLEASEFRVREVAPSPDGEAPDDDGATTTTEASMSGMRLSAETSSSPGGEGTTTTTVNTKVALEADKLDVLRLPDVLDLDRPISNPKVEYDGSTLTVRIASSISVLAMGSNSIEMPGGLVATCSTDGSDATLEASEARVKVLPSPDGVEEKDGAAASDVDDDAMQAMVSGLRISGQPLVPKMALEMDEIASCRVPGVVELDRPIAKPRVEYEGSTMTVVLGSVEATRLEGKQQEPKQVVVDAKKTTPAPEPEPERRHRQSELRSSATRPCCQFVEHTYMTPTNCDVCGTLLKGLWNQGLQCAICQKNIRRECTGTALLTPCRDPEEKGRPRGAAESARGKEGTTKEKGRKGAIDKLAEAKVPEGGGDDAKNQSPGDSLPITSCEASASEPKTDSTREQQESEEEESTDAGSGGAAISVPFPLNLSVGDIVMRSTDGSKMKLTDVDLYLNPNDAMNATQIAFKLGEFKNELLNVVEANVYASLPNDDPNLVQAFNAAIGEARVTAGHTAEEWSDKFQVEAAASPAPDVKSEKKAADDGKSKEEEPLVKLPHAAIAPMKITISWKGTGVAIKDTSLKVKPFVGKADTTSKDLIHWYVGACLNRVPNFISNAEVLGVNVQDTAVSTYGTFLGMGFLGAGGGLAAVAAVDGVKGAIAAGKRSRKADDVDGWRPGDFLRGLVYATEEATRAGAKMRGKEEGKGNVFDYAYGATAGAGEYVGENKSRLGGAGGAGVGFLVGTMVGGPIGGIIGGVIGSAATSTTIDHIEDQVEKSKVKKLEKGPNPTGKKEVGLSMIGEESSGKKG